MARVCIIRQGVFALDAVLTRQTTTLLAAGHDVDLITQRIAREDFDRIHREWSERPRGPGEGTLRIYRIPIGRTRRGRLDFFFEYGAFVAMAAVLVTLLHLRRRYDVVQATSLPDCLVFAAAVPRLLGARVVLFLAECMPEFFVMKYGVRATHPLVRVLTFLERASIRFADGVLTCTDQMRDRFVERGAPKEKIDVILLSADEEVFDPERYRSTRRPDGRFVLVCHGSIQGHYGLDTIVRAVALLKDSVPGLEVRIFGDGPARGQVEALVHELALDDRVTLSRGWVPMEELLQGIADADAGVLAIVRNDFRDLTHCCRMFDLIAMRKPVISSRTRAVEAYFGDSLEMFESGDEHDLARAIREVALDPTIREGLVRRAAEVAEPYRWVHQRQRYLATIERLAARPAKAEWAAVNADASVERSQIG